MNVKEQRGSSGCSCASDLRLLISSCLEFSCGERAVRCEVEVPWSGYTQCWEAVIQ